jgi:hypothetical protein
LEEEVTDVEHGLTEQRTDGPADEEAGARSEVVVDSLADPGGQGQGLGFQGGGGGSSPVVLLGYQ